jgi:predicted metalloprotease
MTFRRDVRLDPGQVRDLRGRRRSGIPAAGGLSIPLPIGGGGIAIVIVLIALLLASGIIDLGGAQSGVNQYPVEDGRGGGVLSEECRTGEDANRRQDCRIVGYVNSIQAYWQDAFAETGRTYQPAETILFDAPVQTGCGQATSQVGPFYCPLDTRVYIDLGFFDQLRTRLGAEGGPLAEAYVLAHEYGHHVQNLTGTLDRGQRTASGPQSGAVRVELQADCYAGVWTGNAVDTGYIEPLTQSEIAVALDAAAAVGDDRIQQTTQGRVTPENWTHGSSAQRQQWFASGYRQADPGACDTFAGEI